MAQMSQINALQIQIKGKMHQVTIPAGYELTNIISAGGLRKGDLVYDARRRAFAVVELDGNVRVEQCHLVLGFRPDWD